MTKRIQRNGAQNNVPFLYRFLTEGKVGYTHYIQSVEEELTRLLEARVSYVKDEDRISILNYGLTDNFFTDLSNNEERFLKEKKLEEDGIAKAVPGGDDDDFAEKQEAPKYEEEAAEKQEAPKYEEDAAEKQEAQKYEEEATEPGDYGE